MTFTPALDGGWGYAVAFGGFFVSFFLDGLEYSFGVLLPSLREDFKVNMSLLTLAGGLITGVCLGIGGLFGVSLCFTSLPPNQVHSMLLLDRFLIIDRRIRTLES